LFGGGEAFDAVDLGVEGEGVDCADAGYPEQPLDVRVGDEMGVERGLEGLDLVLR
jgi:hypothetical protein